jgi:hypothetical protein
MKQYDLYISNDLIIKIEPLTELGRKVYDHIKWKCLEAGVTIEEVSLMDRPRLVRNLRRAGFSVTSRPPKETQ